MVKQFEGKVALVTGAGSGIGRATALAFAAEGAKVTIADTDPKSGEETVQLIKNAGGEAMFVETDVSKASQVEEMVNKTVAAFGRLDYAHNNAGAGEWTTTVNCTEDVFDHVIGVNLKGTWLCMKHEIPAMLQNGGGAIVNTSSYRGLVGGKGAPAYGASKHGINGLTRTAAIEYSKEGVRVNSVCPSVILSPTVQEFCNREPEFEARHVALHPIGRLGKPEEVANVVVWLCSDSASFITGQCVPVDGGFLT